MNIRKFWLLIAIACLLIILVFSVAGCKGELALEEAIKEEVAIKEQLDKELYDKYFSDIRLGSVFLLGGTVNLKKDRNTFLPHQKVCFNAGFKYKNSFLFRTEIFSLKTNNYIERFATTLSSKGSDGLSIEGILLPVGKYDYMVYIENTLIAVLPFEVISYVNYFRS